MSGHSTIHVSFIDEKTGETFAQVHLPLEQLPDAPEGSTLHLGEDVYDVLSATPRSPAEWREGGTLRLVLRKQQVVRMNPQDILYSLPTISDELPSLADDTTKQGKHTLELHEDDWRQVEFVASALQEAIDQEWRAIERIHTQHREGPGFNALHVRQGVPRPLEGTRLTRAELHGALGEATTWLEGLSLHGTDDLVEGGFAARLASGLCLYGIEQEGRVTVLGVHWAASPGAAFAGDARLLAALATRRQLRLIDWCRREQVRLED